MKIREPEDAVYALDEIGIVARAPRNEKIGDYNYERKAADNTSITEWLEQRIYPLISDNRMRVEVVGGFGASPHGRTRLSVVRGSYAR
jgi:hypothetical protein